MWEGVQSTALSYPQKAVSQWQSLDRAAVANQGPPAMSPHQALNLDHGESNHSMQLRLHNGLYVLHQAKDNASTAVD